MSIYSLLDLSGFAFAPRHSNFDWKRVHGVDVDDVVRHGAWHDRGFAWSACMVNPALTCIRGAEGNTAAATAHACVVKIKLWMPSWTQVRVADTQALEGLVECLQHGAIDAEGPPSAHNYVQLFRLLQLAVEYLWQLREGHGRLHAAYVRTAGAAGRCAAGQAGSRGVALAASAG